MSDRAVWWLRYAQACGHPTIKSFLRGTTAEDVRRIEREAEVVIPPHVREDIRWATLYMMIAVSGGVRNPEFDNYLIPSRWPNKPDEQPEQTPEEMDRVMQKIAAYFEAAAANRGKHSETPAAPEASTEPVKGKRAGKRRKRGGK